MYSFEPFPFFFPSPRGQQKEGNVGGERMLAQKWKENGINLQIFAVKWLTGRRELEVWMNPKVRWKLPSGGLWSGD